MNSKYEGLTPGPWHTGVSGRTVYGTDSTVIVVCRSEGDAALIADAPALLADNERLREVLTLVLPRLAHKVNCGSFNPTSEWAEKGSMNFDNCSCEISIVRAALVVGKGGLNENQGDWLEHHRHVRPSANCHLCPATPTQEPK